MHTRVQIDGYDPVGATAVTLYAVSHDEPNACHAGGGTWWPALAKLPVLRYDLFDGAFGGQITAPSSSLTMRTEPWPNFGRYALADARFRLWTGDADTNSWTLRFDGRVTAQPKIADGVAEIAFAVDDRWLDTALLATYAGTTGPEGPAAMKGQAKPLCLGAPRYVPGKLIDSVNNVFQVSAYGAIHAFEAALEKLARFGAPIANYATYAALIAATVPAGTWATATGVGMARFGAPPIGQISFLVQGDEAGPDGWARKPGQLIRRLALLSGGAGKINDAALNALDVARPYNLSLYLDGQTTARELIQAIAASVNAVASMSWTGQLFVAPVGIGTPGVTLAANGSALPPVISVEQIDIAPPWKKLAIGAARAWQVHALADIAFTATLVDLGNYQSSDTYREGNIVQDQDASWLYINPTPTSGNAPPALPTTSNSFWKVLANKGADGADGTDGADGAPGTPGAPGADGQNAKNMTLSTDTLTFKASYGGVTYGTEYPKSCTVYPTDGASPSSPTLGFASSDTTNIGFNTSGNVIQVTKLDIDSGTITITATGYPTRVLNLKRQRDGQPGTDATNTAVSAAITVAAGTGSSSFTGTPNQASVLLKAPASGQMTYSFYGEYVADTPVTGQRKITLKGQTYYRVAGSGSGWSTWDSASTGTESTAQANLDPLPGNIVVGGPKTSLTPGILYEVAVELQRSATTGSTGASGNAEITLEQS